MPGPIETEIKLRIASAAAAREALASIGAIMQRRRHLEDNVLFDFQEKTLRGRGVVLRLRTTPDGAVVTFKGPYRLEGGMKSREEVEAQLAEAEADAMRSILLGLGLRPVFRYQKHRETFAWGGQEIVIDETPIGTFLEIEGDAAGINAAAVALGFSPADYLTGSYAALFAAAGGKGDMVF